MSDIIQYDASEYIMGGINIAEAIQTDKPLIFNESYTVNGYKTESPSVYACYDLTITGDLEAEEIEIHGNLCVTGNIRTKSLYCEKTLFCGGEICADSITAGEILAGNISCKKLDCTGNIIVKIGVDISESLVTDKSVMTGYGITGTGVFSAKNGVAAEYFDFTGEVNGRVLELESGEFFGTPKERTDIISRELKLIESGNVNEEELLRITEQISTTDANLFSDWSELVAHLIEYSHINKVTNLRDYLYIVMAKKILPDCITGHETVRPVFNQLLPEAETNLASMEYYAENIKEFAYSLKIVEICESEIRVEKEELYDRIFQSIGIKYETVRKYMN